MNDFDPTVADTPRRDRSERHVEALRQQGGVFVEAVRLTRMPMIVTDATLPGNPIVFANDAFVRLSGYAAEELVGQDPHFMNGAETDPKAIEQYEESIRLGRDENLEIVQYRKDGAPFRAALFASPLTDGQGTVTNHFLSYLDVSRQYDAEESLRALASELEARVAARTQELEAARDRLAVLLSERDTLMSEVNHRAKNSLAIAASLLAIQGRRQQDKAVKALFDEAQDRLVAMARVHDLLSKSESDQRVELANYVTDLVEALRPITEKDERIRLEAKSEAGILLDANMAVPLGIVLTELVTNAVKYAFPPPRSGTILAEARRGWGNVIELTIEDDGVGMTEFREGSLGYGLIRSLVRQIGAEIQVESQAGVRVTISFPAGVDSNDESSARTRDGVAFYSTSR